jgi:hypothetical protein
VLFSLLAVRTAFLLFGVDLRLLAYYIVECSKNAFIGAGCACTAQIKLDLIFEKTGESIHMKKVIALSAVLGLGALGMACGEAANTANTMANKAANTAANAMANAANTMVNTMANAANTMANTAANTMANAANAMANKPPANAPAANAPKADEKKP